MYIRVFYGGFIEDDDRELSYMLVNPNCPVRMIYDYIRKFLKMKDELEFDLYDDEGSLTFIYDKDPWTNGMDYFEPKKDYFLITFERQFLKSHSNELLSKINKQLNRSRSNKSIKTSRTRLMSASKPSK